MVCSCRDVAASDSISYLSNVDDFRSTFSERVHSEQLQRFRVEEQLQESVDATKHLALRQLER